MISAEIKSRSCADQLFGDQNRHHEVRRNAIRYIITHKNDYTPFMDEDRQPFNSVFLFICDTVTL